MAVVDSDGETLSEASRAHVEGLVREFLAVEYRAVKAMLTAHRPLLDAVADKLMCDPIVDQETLAALVRVHVPALDASCPAPSVNGAGR